MGRVGTTEDKVTRPTAGMLSVAVAGATSMLIPWGMTPSMGAPSNSELRLEAGRLVSSPTDRVRALLNCIDELQHGPAGEGLAPNALAAAKASSVLELAAALGLKPDRVTRDPEGGLSIHIHGPETLQGGASAKYAIYSCDNDGEIVWLTEDRVKREIKTGMVATNEIRESLHAVADFL